MSNYSNSNAAIAKPSLSIRLWWFSIIIMINLNYWLMLSIGTSNGSNKPFLALVVLDSLTLRTFLANMVSRSRPSTAQGIRRPIFAVLQNRTDQQVEQCREVKVDRWRFVGLDKVTSTALGKDHRRVHQCHCYELGPQATPTARNFLQTKQCPCFTETCMIDQNWRFGSTTIEQQILLYCWLLQRRVSQLVMDKEIAWQKACYFTSQCSWSKMGFCHSMLNVETLSLRKRQLLSAGWINYNNFVWTNFIWMAMKAFTEPDFPACTICTNCNPALHAYL